MRKPDQFIIENFRSWHGQHSIDLQNINLLFGTNSSGKSSIIHALSLLKQSQLAKCLIPKSDELDLGRIKDQINKSAYSDKNSTQGGVLKFGLRIHDLKSLWEDYKKPIHLSNHKSRFLDPHNKSRQRTRELDRLQTQLDYLEYIEAYDEFGNIAEIYLNCIHGQLLVIQIERKAKKQVVTLKVSDNQEIWNAFLDLEELSFMHSNDRSSERISYFQKLLAELSSEHARVSKRLNLLEVVKDEKQIQELMSEKEKLSFKIIEIQKQITEAEHEKYKKYAEAENELREAQTNYRTAKDKRSQFQDVVSKYRNEQNKIEKSSDISEQQYVGKQLEQARQNLSKADDRLRYLSAKIEDLSKQLIGQDTALPIGGAPKDIIHHICNSLSAGLHSDVDAKDALSVIREITNVAARNASHEKSIYFDKGDKDQFLGVVEIERTLLKMSRAPGLTHLNFLLNAADRFHNLIDSTVRLGPHRERPERLTFVSSSNSPSEVGSTGQNVMSIINQFSDDQMLELNGWFDLLEIPYVFDKTYNEEFNISQLVLTDRHKQKVSLSDVGYGIGQVLPVVLTSMIAENRLILVEQPELHLHPKLQANLANLFIKSSIDRGNVFILESHSEHIILRFRRLQREGDKKPTTTLDKLERRRRSLDRKSPKLAPHWKSIPESTVISVVEIDTEKGRSSLTRVSINEAGGFEDIWPGEFFPERYIELGLE